MKEWMKTKEFMILMIVSVVFLIISIGNPTAFLNTGNIFDIVKSNLVLAIAAMGMLPIILTGGIDVSVGALMGVASVMSAYFMIHVSDNIALGFLAGALTGVVLGAINGAFIAFMKMPPIVATLGTLSIYQGLMNFITNGNWITNIPAGFVEFGKQYLFDLVPIQFIFLIVMVTLTWWLLKYTYWGRGVFAIGGNIISAERIGFNVKKLQFMLYMFIGFVSGIAGVVRTSIFGQVDPKVFTGFELKVIGAVVVGGASTSGGYGSVLGTLLGVVLMGLLENGMILLKIPTFWQKIFIGSVILFAVTADILRAKRAEAKRVKVDVA
jgi:ribose/xylose/arabinose/galactoside ABC-type transport system permease subunit